MIRMSPGIVLALWLVAAGAHADDLLKRAIAGPMAETPEIIFCTRAPYDDSHWYANIGYFSDDAEKKAYAGQGKPAHGVLYAYNLKTGQKRIIFDAGDGSVRDPHVDYNGQTILFSSRRAGTDYYHLYEIQADGSGLRQITDGPWDDYEASRLPDGDIVFVSTRGMRWVSCWYTQAGILFRCRPDGTSITRLSASLQPDNTPSVMTDGRILYMRWEYIDRSQVEYHGLWTMNPDGSAVAPFFGNMHSWNVMLSGMSIPGSHEVLVCFSPGHGMNEHLGYATIVCPRQGPDHLPSARRIGGRERIRDPFPLSNDLFLMARGKTLLLMNRDGREQVFYTHPNHNAHEPRPLRPRPREPVIASRLHPEETTGHFSLINVYEGRNMEGIAHGDIKSLLIMEPLPKPVNFSGGMDLTSFSGTFNLNRILGTVPVEADGSASFMAPAGRPVFFVALDANDLSVKRMQSFTNVMPGESLSCVGCHESRAMSADVRRPGNTPLALQRPPSTIQPFAGFPDVLDFQRDIQPILDRNCVACHNPEQRAGGLNLIGSQTPRFSSAYIALLTRKEVMDGRNGLGNQPPRSIGSAASPLLQRLAGGHQNVKASPEDWRTAWLWIESSAPYAGSYAALRNTEQQNHFNRIAGAVFSEGRDVFNRRCSECHQNTEERNLTGFPFNWTLRNEREKKTLGRPTGAHERIILPPDPARMFDAHVLIDYSRPGASSILLAPLAKAAGGYGRCGRDVFKDRNDPDFKKLLAAIEKAKARLDQRPPWGMPGWQPNPQYIREMRRFGIVPADYDPVAHGFDPFAMDQAYWRALWTLTP